MYHVLPEHLPVELLIFEEGEEREEAEECFSEEEGDDVVSPTPAIVSAIMNQPRNTPILNLIDKVSAEVRKSPALEKSRLRAVVNAGPNTPNSHTDRIQQLNTTIAADHYEALHDRSHLAIKYQATLPFTLPGTPIRTLYL